MIQVEAKKPQLTAAQNIKRVYPLVKPLVTQPSNGTSEFHSFAIGSTYSSMVHVAAMLVNPKCFIKADKPF